MNHPVKLGRFGLLALTAGVMVLGIVIACGEEEPTAYARSADRNFSSGNCDRGPTDCSTGASGSHGNGV